MPQGNNVGLVGGYNPPVLLAAQRYAPATEQAYNIGSASFVAMDSTNLTVGPFEIPSSGNYYVDVTADFAFAGTASLAAATDMFMGLALHGTTTLVTSDALASWTGSNQPSFVYGARHTHRYYIFGDTPFAQRQLDLVMGLSSVTNISFASFYAWNGNSGTLSSNPVGPIVIQVFSA